MSLNNDEEKCTQQTNQWKQKRIQQKQEKREAKQLRREELVKEMTVEQLEEYDNEHLKYIEQLLVNKRLKQQEQNLALQQANYIIIDLEFYELMTSSELKSLHQQILYCYGLSKKSKQPLRLSLLNYQNQYLNLSNCAGFENWIIDYINSYEDLNLSNLIYLTADSQNEMVEYQKDKIYIIGGLVDRNRHKNICQLKAEKMQIRTERIPIKKYVNLQTSQVITCNQVFQLMQLLNEGITLENAIKNAIPQRKVVQQ